MKTNNKRIINLFDCDTNFLVETDAPKEEIIKALQHKNEMLINDDPNFRCDFEEMQDYLWEKGYYFESIGYVEDIEAYNW